VLDRSDTVALRGKKYLTGRADTIAFGLAERSAEAVQGLCRARRGGELKTERATCRCSLSARSSCSAAVSVT
jgi:hypothetical protein